MRFQLLWHIVVIEASDEAVREILPCIVNTCEQTLEPRLEMRYQIRPAGESGFTVIEEGDVLSHERDPGAVLDRVYSRIYQRALEYASLCGWVRLHAGVAVVGGSRRVLVAAPTQAGKTTLLLRLLFDGVAVHGDENVLVRDGDSVAVPRLFRVTDGAQGLLPELALARLLPELPGLGGRMLDPGAVGLRWRIDKGHVDDVVLLDGRSSSPEIRPADATAVMPALVAEALPNLESTAALLREIAAILRSARCWRLRVGAPAETARLVRGLAS